MRGREGERERVREDRHRKRSSAPRIYDTKDVVVWENVGKNYRKQPNNNNRKNQADQRSTITFIISYVDGLFLLITFDFSNEAKVFVSNCETVWKS